MRFQKRAKTHSYAGITRIRFEGSRRDYSASQPTYRRHPLHLMYSVSIAMNREKVKGIDRGEENVYNEADIDFDDNTAFLKGEY